MDLDDLYDRQNLMHVTAVSWKSREYIAWRESHYGHVAMRHTPSEAGGRTITSLPPGGGDVRSGSGSGSGSSGSSSAVSDTAAIIEPFPYTPLHVT